LCTWYCLAMLGPIAYAEYGTQDRRWSATSPDSREDTGSGANNDWGTSALQAYNMVRGSFTHAVADPDSPMFAYHAYYKEQWSMSSAYPPQHALAADWLYEEIMYGFGFASSRMLDGLVFEGSMPDEHLRTLEDPMA
jgi:hypothetical protein